MATRCFSVLTMLTTGIFVLLLVSPRVQAVTPLSPKVAFAGLSDGAVVHSPFNLKFKVDGMQVEPAGEVHPKSGHHHLIVDGGAVPTGEVIVADQTHLHFGKGQTETTLELSKGEHTLTLQFADGAHRSYGLAYSSTIRVRVE